MEILQFIVLGLGVGALYSLGAQGLAVIYRGSGVINFSHGAMALLGAAVFIELRQEMQLPLLLAAIVAVAVTSASGLIIDRFIMSRLHQASPLSRLVVTLGVLAIIESVVIIRYGSGLRFVDGFLPDQSINVAPGLEIGADRLLLVAIALIATLLLWGLYRFTDFGRQTTAVAENQRSAAALGISAGKVSALNWMLGAALAAITGILLAPVTGLMPATMVLLINPLLAAALVGSFSSFPVILLAGLVIGVAQGVIGALDEGSGWSASVPFLVIVITMVLRGRALPLRGFIGDRLPLVGAGHKPGWPMLIGVLAAVVVILSVSEDLVNAITGSLLAATVLLSIVTVTGLAGQVSLAQYGLAGVGAFVSARLAAVYGFSFPLALLTALLVAVVTGALFALPALRTRGVNLAIVTLGLGLALDNLLFKNIAYTGGYSGTQVSPPSLLGFSLDGILYPQRYALVALAGFCLCAWLLNNVRLGVSGRRLLATRGNERAALSVGVNVVATKLYGFALGAGFAAIGGVLTAFRYPNVRFDAGYSPFESIPALLMAFLGGIGFIAGALIGGLMSVGGLMNELLAALADLKEWQGLLVGVGVIAIVIAHPNGLAEAFYRVLRKWRKAPLMRSQESAQSCPAQVPETAPVTGKTLRVKDLSVRFGGLTALDQVSLEVQPGEVVGLIGPNGAGKTTLIDAISGFTAFATGQCELEGSDITLASPLQRSRSGIGRTFQSLELFDDLCVADNLRVAMDGGDNHYFLRDLVRPESGAGLPDHLLHLLQRCGLDNSLSLLPSELSFGQRRLLGLARAVAAGPSVLLLDEPAAGLDTAETEQLAELIVWLASQQGLGILLIEHDMTLVMAVCSKLVVLDFGSVIATGSPDQVSRDPAVVDAYLGVAEEEGSRHV